MTDKKRRQLVTFMGASTVAVPVSALLGSLPSYADEAPLVDETSAAAKNWEYVAESAVEGNMCSNCALFQGDTTAPAGACPLFAGSQVASAGWCKAWVAKP